MEPFAVPDRFTHVQSSDQSGNQGKDMANDWNPGQLITVEPYLLHLLTTMTSWILNTRMTT